MNARRAAWFGAAGPIGFLAVGFAMAAARHELIVSRGWASWPSSMATGGPPAALPQLAAFLWLAGCYLVFDLAALRPVLRAPAVTGGFLAIAAGDVLLAFPTDVPGVAPTWHGSLHLAGVVLATVATVVATAASLVVTRGRAGWRAWRIAAAVLFACAAVGAVAGFTTGWAKVVYVVGITAPVPVLAWRVRREAADTAGATEAARPSRPPTGARSG